MRKTLGIVAAFAFAALTVGLVDPAASAIQADGVGIQSLTTSFFTGTVSPGVTQTWKWNNAPSGLSYVVGLSPKGASTTQDCLFEVTRSWNQDNFGGEREFLVRHEERRHHRVHRRHLPGDQDHHHRDRHHVPRRHDPRDPEQRQPALGLLHRRLRPGRRHPATPCLFELDRGYYAQVINDDGSTEREFRQIFSNVGSITCSASKLLAAA